MVGYSGTGTRKSRQHARPHLNHRATPRLYSSRQRKNLRLMALLTGTSILARLANRADALYPITDAAVAKLFLQKEIMVRYASSNNASYLANRPTEVNKRVRKKYCVPRRPKPVWLSPNL
jgi:hypothetical protein